MSLHFSSSMSHPQPQRTESSDSDALRKRVCKACDRCRLKKSKCDGASPCSRCSADNAICVFGERKKSHDKIYPKGYVEMLEQQQSQLVTGLQEMYHRMLAAKLWEGPVLSESAGHPLTHDILSAMGLLEKKHEGSDETIPFEEDCEKLQARMIADGAVLTKRRGSIGSDSDRSHRANSSSHSTPTLSKPALFRENFSFTSCPSPPRRSPAPKQQRRSHPPAAQSPLHQNPPMTNNDPQLYQAAWSFAGQTTKEPEFTMQSDYPAKSAFVQSSTFDLGDFTDNVLIDSPMDQAFDFGDVSYSQINPQMISNAPMPDFAFAGYDPMMEVDFKNFIAA